MAFQGKTVFIPGGCGTVGSGLTRSFLQNGAKVAVASRSQERLDELKKSVDKKYQADMTLIKEDVSTEEGAKKALDALVKQGGVQHVIASMGSWWHRKVGPWSGGCAGWPWSALVAKGEVIDACGGGPLTKQSVEEFDKSLNERARSHFICAKVFLPYLANSEGTTYTILTGAALDTFVVADISLILAASGCLFGISAAAQAEFKESKVVVNEVRIGCFVKPKLDKDLEEKSFVLDGNKLDIIGNDIFADFMVCVLKARAKGLVKVYTRKDLEEQKKKL